MRIGLVVGVLAAATASITGHAEDAPAVLAPPASPYTFTANVNAVTDYYFRGLTQTWGQPAIQGGFDASHTSGLYAGFWASNVSGNQFAGGSLETDWCGGYSHKLNDDFTLGAGLIYYWYPNANYNQAAGCATTACADQSYNTFEGNLSAAWKFLTFKWSYAFTDYFGANQSTGYDGDTNGTMYFDLSANYPLKVLGGLNIIAHVGYTHYSAEVLPPGFNGETDPSYWDWKLGVSKTWDAGWNLGLFYVQGSNNFWENTQSLSTTAPDTKDLNKAMVFVQFGKTF
jgi:uncharacterized protein (TIGR02001 family)